MGIFFPDIKKMESDNDTPGLILLLKRRNPDIRLRAFRILADKLERDELFDKTGFLLRDRDRKVKNYVAVKFCSMGNREVFHYIHGMIMTGRRDEKVQALQALPLCNYPDKDQVLGLLFHALNDDKLIVQTEAMRALGHFDGVIVTERIIAKLHDRHYQLRLEAVRSLVLSSGESGIDHIMGAMVDQHPLVRRAAVNALENIPGEKARCTLGNRDFIRLVREMNENFSVRLHAVRAIGEKQIYEGIPLLFRACRDSYKSMRIEAVRSLASFKNPQCTGVLMSMLGDRYWDIRLEAVRALGKIRDAGALPGIQIALEDGNFNVRTEAKEAYTALKKNLENH